VAFRIGYLQTRAILSRSIGKRVDKHVDGDIRRKVLIHLLPDESGGKRHLQASGRNHMDRIVDDHNAMGNIL